MMKNQITKWKQKLSRQKSNQRREVNRPRATSWAKLSRFGNINTFFTKLFDPQIRPSIHRGALIALILITAYGSAKFISFLFISDGEQLRPIAYERPYLPKTTGNDLKTIQNANLFRARTDDERKVVADQTPKVQENILCEEADKRTSLPLALTNTIVLQDEVKSLASVQIRGGETKNVRKGDRINSIARVGKIERLKVIVKNLQTGECEYISDPNMTTPRSSSITVVDANQGKALLPQNRPVGIRNEGTNYAICKSLIDEQLQDLGSILTQAKADPFPNADGSLSFRLSQVQPGGIFSYLGVQEGDVITKINNNPIKNLQEVMTLFSGITSLQNLQLTIEREGTEVSFDYQFEPEENCE